MNNKELLKILKRAEWEEIEATGHGYYEKFKKCKTCGGYCDETKYNHGHKKGCSINQRIIEIEKKLGIKRYIKMPKARKETTGTIEENIESFLKNDINQRIKNSLISILKD